MTVKGAIQNAYIAVLIGVTLICVLSPSLLFLKQITAYTLYIMLGILAAGLMAFAFGRERMMMVSLICCIVLCLHLKDSSNQRMRLAAVTSNPSIRISHISLGNVESDYDQVIDYLLRLDADLLCFQELTPDWNTILQNRLASSFLHIRTMSRLDQYGIGFFSKLPFLSFDTLYFQQIPFLAGTVNLGPGRQCHVISSQVMPPVNQMAFKTIADHFYQITSFIQHLEGPTVVLGDFHLPPWSSEVQKFKLASRLQDGRRDIHPRNLDGSLSLPRIPVEHILYNEDLECTSFSEIGNARVGRIGITGTYQLLFAEEDIIY